MVGVHDVAMLSMGVRKADVQCIDLQTVGMAAVGFTKQS
jgi:hypothetical protein